MKIVIKGINNQEVFKLNIKDKNFVLYFIREEFIITKEEEKSKLKEEKYLLKNINVHKKKVDE